MRRITLIFAMTFCITLSMTAQPKAIGGRIGATGFEVSYEHTIRNADFIEADAGMDFGYNGNGKVGVKATGIYNFMFARPAWTQRGTWGLYAGPGLSLGYVDDKVKIDRNHYYQNHGFMLSVVAQVGLEYTFWFPLQLSVDLRPMFGMHVNDAIYSNPDVNGLKTKLHGSKVGYYDGGWLGFAPTVSVRYRF